MNPTGLPELSKPLRDLNFDQKCEKLKFQNFSKFQKIEKIVFFIRDHHISMNPGLEPILLDLGKLFLLSDDGNSRE